MTDAFGHGTADRLLRVLSEDMQDSRRLSGVEFIYLFAADAPARLAALLEA